MENSHAWRLGGGSCPACGGILGYVTDRVEVEMGQDASTWMSYRRRWFFGADQEEVAVMMSELGESSPVRHKMAGMDGSGGQIYSPRPW